MRPRGSWRRATIRIPGPSSCGRARSPITISSIPEEWGDWGSHDREHELSAAYDIAHGAGLAVVFPAWLKYFFKHDVKRFAQVATRIWGIDLAFVDPERSAIAGIARLESFWSSLGLAVRLTGLGIGKDHVTEMAENGSSKGT